MLLVMTNYLKVHDYPSKVKAQLAIYNLNRKVAWWWWDLNLTKNMNKRKEKCKMISKKKVMDLDPLLIKGLVIFFQK